MRNVVIHLKVGYQKYYYTYCGQINSNTNQHKTNVIMGTIKYIFFKWLNSVILRCSFQILIYYEWPLCLNYCIQYICV